MELLLLIIARLMQLILTVVLLSYGLVKSFIVGGRKAWFKEMAIAIDELGNVMGKYLFNDVLIKKHGWRFGDRNETISKVLGINKRLGTLTPFGVFVGQVLNSLDKNHLEKASNNDTK